MANNLDLLHEDFLSTIRAELKKCWNKKKSAKQIARETGSIGAILAKQTANFEFLNGGSVSDKIKFQLEWTTIPPPSKSSGKGDLHRIGRNGNVKKSSKVYEVQESVAFKMAGIEMNKLTRIGVDPKPLIAEVLSDGLVHANAHIADKFYSGLKSNAGQIKTLHSGITYDAPNKTHIVSAALWNDKPSLMALLTEDIIPENVASEIIIGGKGYMVEMKKAEYLKDNPDSIGDYISLSEIETFAGGNPLTRADEARNVFYLVDTNAFAALARGRYTNQEKVSGNGFDYTVGRIPSRVIAGCGFDWYQAPEFDETDNTIYFCQSLVNANEILFREPELANDMAGIYRFVKE